MPTLKCNSCDNGPCHIQETPDMESDWPCECEKGFDVYADWTRQVTQDELWVIRQPVAMKIELQEFLTGRYSPKSIADVMVIINQYMAKAGEK
jgi:hypothetical protein